MTDAITLLSTDHRTIDGLFAQVEGQATPDQGVVDRIVKELSVHDAIEKSHLYPVLRHRVEGGERLADRSVDEHDEQAKLLVDVEHAGPDGLRATLATLINSVRTHVAEEESESFPALRSSLSEAELDDLGGVLERAKASAPTRPHPHAPSEGLGTKVAGAVSAPLDKARDAVEGR